MTSYELADIAAGFASPVQGSQRMFRVVLQATARPGRIQQLPAEALSALQAPAPMGRAMCAALLTLLDAEVRAHFSGRLHTEEVRRYLSFHCGAQESDAASADFVAAHAQDVTRETLSSLRDGSDQAPQDGATLLVEVPSLLPQGRGARLVLRGPGVNGEARLAVDGLAETFWRERMAREVMFPRGIDLLLTCGERFAAIPRSTRIALEV